MTDELTPEEREALKNLPRERMPVGLEGRVVDAMRERGFLARPRRTVVITNSRIAGVIAASLALIVTAYSIGLYIGAGEPFLPPIATLEGDAGRTTQRANQGAVDEGRPPDMVRNAHPRWTLPRRRPEPTLTATRPLRRNVYRSSHRRTDGG